jgi:hypothetical protein
MSGTVWIKHPELGAVSEVPESALPIWRQSGWDLLTDAAVDERAAAEAWMQEIAENARAVQAPPPPGLVDVPPSAPPPEQPDEDAVGRQTTKEIG